MIKTSIVVDGYERDRSWHVKIQLFLERRKTDTIQMVLQPRLSNSRSERKLYRFPMPSWIKAWRKCPPGFDFSIKVHRSITHYKKLGMNSIRTWEKFRSGFKDIEDKITFWLFQMPPSFTATQQNINWISVFFEELNLGNSAVIEFRHQSWWDKKEICRKVGATFCSVDAPGLPREIVSMNDSLYLRLHGREVWYASVYPNEELEQIIEQVRKQDASKKYIYLNNNHGMLPNGKYLMGHL